MHETFRTTRRVEFRDTDAAGIVHFSAYFVFMESVEHEFLRHIGTSVYRTEEGQDFSWPRVSATCDFRGAVRFEDQLDVELTIERLGESSVTFRHRFEQGGRLVALGRMVSVHCRISHDGPSRSTPIPTPIAQRLRDFVAEASGD